MAQSYEKPVRFKECSEGRRRKQFWGGVWWKLSGAWGLDTTNGVMITFENDQDQNLRSKENVEQVGESGWQGHGGFQDTERMLKSRSCLTSSKKHRADG